MTEIPDDAANALDLLDRAADLLRRAGAVQADAGERVVLRSAEAITRASVTYLEEYYG